MTLPPYFKEADEAYEDFLARIYARAKEDSYRHLLVERRACAYCGVTVVFDDDEVGPNPSGEDDEGNTCLLCTLCDKILQVLTAIVYGEGTGEPDESQEYRGPGCDAACGC
jgi:hypothetical protein